jgi:hypothetical protein
MPGQEVAGIMNLQCLLDVGHDEVVVLDEKRQVALPLLRYLRDSPMYLRETLRRPRHWQESSAVDAANTVLHSRS